MFGFYTCILREKALEVLWEEEREKRVLVGFLLLLLLLMAACLLLISLKLLFPLFSSTCDDVDEGDKGLVLDFMCFN